MTSTTASRPGDPILAIIGDPTRRAMLEMLRQKPLAVGEIAGQLPVSRPAVSQHLRKLKEARLVSESRRGTRHYFSLDPAGFAELREYVDAMWQDALTAFAAYVSEQKATTTGSGGQPRKKGPKR